MGGLNGLKIAVTGTLNNFTRDEVAAYINRNGGTFSGTVTKDTQYLVVGDKPGWKYYRSDLTNTTKISEKDLYDLANRDMCFKPRPTSVREKLKAVKLSNSNIDSMVKELVQKLDYDLFKEMYVGYTRSNYDVDKTDLRNIVRKYL